MNEITSYAEKMVILMKSGLIHWVSKDTGTRFADHISNQNGHSMVKIRELNNIVINTAEIEAVYNHEQYRDLCRVKSGEWQCSYGNWHMRKGECRCEQEKQKDREQKEREKEEEILNRASTPEERKTLHENLRKMNEEWALDGAPIARTLYRQGNEAGRTIRLSTIREWEKKNGRKALTIGLNIEK